MNHNEAQIQVTSITKESIVIKVNVAEAAIRKKRYYIHLYGKEEYDDLGIIDVKKNKNSGTAIIDLEEIEEKIFEIALYKNEHDKNKISNKLAFKVNNNDEIVLLTEPPLFAKKNKSKVQPETNLNQMNTLYNVVSSSSDDDEYGDNMYTNNAFENVSTEVTEEKKEETKEEKKENEETLALEIYYVQCEEKSCERRFDPADVFFCKHDECKDDIRIYCGDSCMPFKHTHKNHKFDPNEKYMFSVRDLLMPNGTAFHDEKAKAGILVKISDVKDFLFHHRWTMNTASKLLILIGHAARLPAAISGKTAVAGSIAGSLNLATSPLMHGLIAGTLGGAAGGLIGFAMETGLIFWKCGQKQISQKEAFKLTAISAASNTVAGLGFVGVMAIGGAFGSPGGPIGWVIGATIAALLFGFATRYGLNKWFENKFKKKNDPENDLELQKRALHYFFDDENYDIKNEKIFNDTILKKTYHIKALKVHPNRNGGGNQHVQEWLKLSGYYGMLIGIWETKHKKQVEISTENDLDDDQHSSLVNSHIKSIICNMSS
eukprot:315206_1